MMVPALLRIVSRTSSSREILMRQHEVHPVLAQLGKHIGKAQCREVLELIEIDVEISPLVFGNVSPAEAGEPDT